MADANMIRPFVHQVVAQTLGIDVAELKIDPNDGSVPISTGSTRFFVHVVDGPGGPVLQVFAPMVTDVKRTAKLAHHLNDLNSDVYFSRLFWKDNTVFCVTEIPAEDLNPSQVRVAMDAVSVTADRWDDSIAKDFGGRVAWPADAEEGDLDASHASIKEGETPGYM